MSSAGLTIAPIWDYVGHMTLQQYLARHRITSREFATRVGVTKSAVRKWRQGLRIPRKATLIKINKHTRGQVRATDWY